MSVANGALARLARAEDDIKELSRGKADRTAVESLEADIREVKVILLWFLGIASTVMIAGFGIVIGMLAG